MSELLNFFLSVLRYFPLIVFEVTKKLFFLFKELEDKLKRPAPEYDNLEIW